MGASLMERKRGFFWPGDSRNQRHQEPIRTSKKSTRRTTYNPKKPCVGCDLKADCNSPRMDVQGKGKLRILIVGQAPGKTEDKVGRQFAGSAGKILKSNLRANGFDLDRDFWRDNVVACWTHTKKGTNRTPTNNELNRCWHNTAENIRRLKPRAVFLMGKEAIYSYLMYRRGFTKKLTVEQWRMWAIPDREFKCWIIPMGHPSALQYDRKNQALANQFRRDLKKGVKLSRKLLSKLTDEEPKIEIVKDNSLINKLIHEWRDHKGIITFDYETTGLKPFVKGHQILCIGVSTDGDRGYAFPTYPIEKYGSNLMFFHQLVLANKKIKKGGHNNPFEELWSRIRGGGLVKGWYWDSMQAAHVLDDRKRIAGLKFQAFIRYGVSGYDDSVAPYIKSKHPNAFNRLRELMDSDPDSVLLYCGMDAMFEHRLGTDQRRELKVIPGKRKSKSKLGNAYWFWHKGSIELVDAQEAGIPISEEFYDKERARLRKEERKILKRVGDSKEAKLYRQRSGQDEFNPGSPDQLRTLLFEYLKLTPEKGAKKTKTGQDKVDRPALESINTRFTKDVLRLRRINKVVGTYIDGFQQHATDGIMHPFFHLHTVRTYRSSSADPNFQNVPKRDREAMRVVRSGIVPSPGNRLIEIDYGGIEVCMAACNTLDPVLIDYVSDKSSDMHRDQAIQLFFLDNSYDWKHKNMKEIRYGGKNGFVFPEFYGSYAFACAKDIWNMMKAQSYKLEDGTPLIKHLKANGIRNFNDFVKHVEHVEKLFWKRFCVYADWKEEWVERYLKTGKIPMKTGFRRQGILARNKVLNTANQGMAFHCLLWSFIKLNKLRKRERWESKIIGQIHDSIVINAVEDEIKHIVKSARKIMCHDIRKKWKWIVVPLEIDVDVTKIDGSWAETKGYKMKKRHSSYRQL